MGIFTSIYISFKNAKRALWQGIAFRSAIYLKTWAAFTGKSTWMLSNLDHPL